MQFVQSRLRHDLLTKQPVQRPRARLLGLTTLAVFAGTAYTSGFTGNSFHNGAYWVEVPSYASNDPFKDMPDTLTLNGTVRDFREWSEPGGHIDFESRPANNFGHYVNIVADDLDEQRLPVFRSVGRKVLTQARNTDGQNVIGDKPYIAPQSGDTARVLQGSGDLTGQDSGTTLGEYSGRYDYGTVFNETTFNQWFRDVPGLNTTSAFPTTLVRQPGTDLYVFDDKDSAHFRSQGGFFIINDQGYGNSAGDDKNFHFTYHLQTDFLYKKGAGQTFRFIGDDDVWVFIDGKLVIDLGGIHSAIDQIIEMDRLTTLEHGKMHTLDFFFAERHRTQSNFRIETNLILKRPVNVPRGSNLFD